MQGAAGFVYNVETVIFCTNSQRLFARFPYLIILSFCRRSNTSLYLMI